MKKLIIMRGLPGSGKSTFAAKMEGWGKDCVRHSTDDYFMNPYTEQYEFDHKKIGDAHLWNQSHCEHSMLSGCELVVVDNTNTTYNEMKPYLEMARRYDYEVVLQTFEPNENELDVYAKRNLHGVPAHSIQRMFDRWQPNRFVSRYIERDFPNLKVEYN